MDPKFFIKQFFLLYNISIVWQVFPILMSPTHFIFKIFTSQILIGSEKFNLFEILLLISYFTEKIILINFLGQTWKLFG